jgi:sterol 3beta-glucosyltransferase
MRIGVLTWGSEGDVRPFVALSRGLSEAGHEVTFSYATFTEMPELSLRGGAKTVPVTPPYDLATVRPLSRQLIGKKVSPEKQIALVFEHLFYPMERQRVDAAEALCRDNDVVVGHFVAYPLAMAAQKAGRPRVSVFTAPSLRHGPTSRPGCRTWESGSPGCSGGSERSFGGPVRRLFRAHGLTPAKSLLHDVWGSPLLNLVGVSPTPGSSTGPCSGYPCRPALTLARGTYTCAESEGR